MGRRWQMLGVAACLCLCTTRASAYEDQLTVAAGAGYVHNPLLDHGGLLDVAVGVGLDDIWTLRLRGSGLWHPSTDARATAAGALMGAELLYLVDVLQWVPYAGLGADGLLLVLPAGAELGVGGHFVVGLDYLASREWIVGLDLRVLYGWTAAGQLRPATLVNLAVRRAFEI